MLKRLIAFGLIYIFASLFSNRRDITFLYRLEDGVCPRSFGMHVARMAGMVEEVRWCDL